MKDRYVGEVLEAIKCLEGDPEGSKVAARFAVYTAASQNMAGADDAVAAAVDYLISEGAAPFSRDLAIHYAHVLRNAPLSSLGAY